MRKLHFSCQRFSESTNLGFKKIMYSISRSVWVSIFQLASCVEGSEPPESEPYQNDVVTQNAASKCQNQCIV
jgi:hypothetical protein